MVGLPREIQLQETRPTFLAVDELSEADAAAIEDTKLFELEYPSPRNGHRFVINSPRTVGVVPIHADLRVRITPKVSIGSLFGMMEMAYGLASTHFYRGTTEATTVDEAFALFADLLARGVLRRVRRGLHADYVEVTETLGTLRGSLDLAGTMRDEALGKTGFHCRHSLLTTDVDHNGVLLAALDRIPRMSLEAGTPESVRFALRVMRGVATLREYSGNDIASLRYTRLNADYAELHALARFFIETVGPGMEVGRHASLPFRVDMPVIFEAFAANALRESLDGALTVDDATRVELVGDFGLELKMDVVLRESGSGRSLAVLDAKYKPSARPTQDDLNQVVTYATALGVRRAVLLYPLAVAPSSILVGDVLVTSLGLDLSRRLSEATDAVASQLRSLLGIEPLH